MGGLFDRLIGQFRRASPVGDGNAAPEPIDRADIAEQIEIRARGGFHTGADVLDTILGEYLTPEEIGAEDRRWIETEIDLAFARKQAEEAAWPDITDVDRLDAAFDDLNAAGIIALHRAGYTRSDGISDAWEARAQAEEAGEAPRGYAFYHGQDVESAAMGNGLYLAFGAFDGRDATTRYIAGEIVSAMKRHGLRTQWEGDVDVRIFLFPLEWCKRSPSA